MTDINAVPTFPENPVEGWIDPWGKLWVEWCKIPTPFMEPALLFPAFIAAHANLLNGKYKSGSGRNPNFAFLTIAPSGSGKDVNSMDVFISINKMIEKNGSPSSPFSSLVKTSALTSSATGFMRRLDKKGKMLLLDTEATYFFQQLAQSGQTNSSVKAIESCIAQAVDGRDISEKHLTVKSPSCQILFYAHKYARASTVENETLSNMIVSVLPDPKGVSLGFEETDEYCLSDEILDFYSREPDGKDKPIKIHISNDDIGVINDWILKEFPKKVDHEKSEALTTVLLKMEMISESLYTLVVGVAVEYRMGLDKSLNESDLVEEVKAQMNIESLLGVLNYWADSKCYVVKEYID